MKYRLNDVKTGRFRYRSPAPLSVLYCTLVAPPLANLCSPPQHGRERPRLGHTAFLIVISPHRSQLFALSCFRLLVVVSSRRIVLNQSQTQL